MAKTKEAALGEWLYLAKEGVSVRQIANAVEGCYEIELWEEAGVLEIILTEGASMDVEHTKIHPADELTQAFVKKQGCTEVFLVTFLPEHHGMAENIMRRILAECGGIFCGDTVDFEPVIK